jgi:hypothetical protein
MQHTLPEDSKNKSTGVPLKVQQLQLRSTSEEHPNARTTMQELKRRRVASREVLAVAGRR